MKIKRFFAPDMRQAIRNVSKELGPDAVILSNKKVKGGIEIVAAVDFDETLLQPEKAQASKRTDQDEQLEAPDSNDFLSVTSSTSHSAPEPAGADKQPDLKENIIWSQEPTLEEIRKELNDLRGLLELQLSGLAWGETARRHPLRAKLIRHLIAAGFSPEHSRDTAAHIPDDIGFEKAWHQALENIANELPVLDDDILDRGGVISLVGPTGVGKTTSIAKLAARYALRHGRKHIALVTTDNYRIGAHEQLRTYGRILGIPVYTATNQSDMHEVVKNLCDKALVLIDTPGMSQRDARLARQLEMIMAGVPQAKNYLVLSATTQYQGLDEIITTYKKISLHGCILTKLDESFGLGGSLSVVIKHGLPIAYVSDGQRVPEDIQVARARNLISRAVKIMQQTRQEPGDELLERAFRGKAVNANV